MSPLWFPGCQYVSCPSCGHKPRMKRTTTRFVVGCRNPKCKEQPRTQKRHQNKTQATNEWNKSYKIHKKEYYVQDSRGYVGNAVSWWGKNRAGYTCDIDEAGIYNEEEAAKICKNRKTDVMWEKDYIDQKISRYIDMQHLDCNKVIKGNG